MVKIIDWVEFQLSKKKIQLKNCCVKKGAQRKLYSQLSKEVQSTFLLKIDLNLLCLIMWGVRHVIGGGGWFVVRGNAVGPYSHSAAQGA